MPTKRKAEVIQQKHITYIGIQIHVPASKGQKHIFKLHKCVYCTISSRQERIWHMLAEWRTVPKSVCANRFHKILPKHIYYWRAWCTSFLCKLQQTIKVIQNGLKVGCLVILAWMNIKKKDTIPSEYGKFSTLKTMS